MLKGIFSFFGNVYWYHSQKLILPWCTPFWEDGKAKEVLDTRLLIVYIPVYIFCIWDSYRLTVDLNKSYYLAKREKAPIVLFTMNQWGINILLKENQISYSMVCFVSRSWQLVCSSISIWFFALHGVQRLSILPIF